METNLLISNERSDAYGSEELKVLKSETWVAPVAEPVLEEPTI